DVDPRRLGHAEPAAVEELEERAVALRDRLPRADRGDRVLARRFHERSGVLRAEERRELSPDLRRRELGGRVRLGDPLLLHPPAEGADARDLASDARRLARACELPEPAAEHVHVEALAPSLLLRDEREEPVE